MIKKIPHDITEKTVKDALSEFGNIKRVKLLMHKFYAYVEFEEPSRAQVCVNYFQKNSLTLNGQTVLVYLTSSGKNEHKPLDLNPPSNILLCTFFKNKIPIGINVVLDVMEKYDVVEKVSIEGKSVFEYILKTRKFSFLSSILNKVTNLFYRLLFTRSRTFML